MDRIVATDRDAVRLRPRRVTAEELSLAFYLATEPLWNPQCLGTGLHQILVLQKKPPVADQGTGGKG